MSGNEWVRGSVAVSRDSAVAAFTLISLNYGAQAETGMLAIRIY